MTRALILSGGGSYADPWHPFAETSEEIATLLRGLDFEVEIANDIEDRLGDLTDIDLIVTNAAAGPDSDRRASAHAAIREYLARGGGFLAVHVGAATLVDFPEWESVTGMAWINGVSMHPPVGPSHLTVHSDLHPIVEGIVDFDVFDERYSKLRTAPDIVALVSHELDGTVYPLVWARTHGDARIVVDTLAHSAESFESPEHQLLIRRSALWVTHQLD